MNSLELGYYGLGINYGYYIDKAPQNVLEELGQQINGLQSDFDIGEKYNHMLAGEIEHEYLIEPQFQTKQYIKDLVQQFEGTSQYIISNYGGALTLGLNQLWINFQKKHEYNPIHNHSGILSFVIWYKIPYTFENETKHHYGSDDGSKCMHGKFSFVFPTSHNKRTNIYTDLLPIDKSKEGYVVIFPSSLNHMVYPFYSSDGYRITVAGNIMNV